MNSKTLLTRPAKEIPPDKEECLVAGVTVRSRRTARKDNLDLEHNGRRYGFTRMLSSIFPSPSDEQTQAYIPHYRILPILSGITIPFSILLDIPGLLTADWYNRADGSIVLSSKPNSSLHFVGIALSILCIIFANVCLVVRFLERRVKTMTILCSLLLFIHDTINVAALVTFSAVKNDYAYYHAFWTTFCSTIVSTFTNVTLIVDLIRTPGLTRSGSGLTQKQRSLIIIITCLFCYIALGTLVSSLLLDLTFVNGLYFTIVTIVAIGFGDIVPHSTVSRIFIYFYAPLGMINMAFVVGHIRETVLEGLDFGHRRRLLAIQERRRATRRRIRAEKRWKHAIIWRLREGHAPIWIPKETNGRKTLWSILTSYFWRAEWRILLTVKRSTNQSRGERGMQLNLWALSPCQLEASALEAGAPLNTLLPAGFHDTYDQDGFHPFASIKHHTLPSWFAVRSVYHRGAEHPTHLSLGAMAAILTKLNLALYESGGNPLPNRHGDTPNSGSSEATLDDPGSLQAVSLENEGDHDVDVADAEKKAHYIRSALGWLAFLVFWMGGAAIFKVTEGWTYKSSIYFCFTAFSTVGYGDLTPLTEAGRSIFAIWALIGAGIMTGFVSVVSEACASRYKAILDRSSSRHEARRYRECKKVESNEMVQRVATKIGTKFVLHDREKTDTVGDELPPASAMSDDGTTPFVTSESASVPDQHDQCDRRRWSPQLEVCGTLSRQILTEIRLMLRYMQLINDSDQHLAQEVRFVDQSTWSLIDDVMDGRKLTDGAKKDILRDAEARQTLMLFGIIRSLRELVNISEQAVTAVQERERITAPLQQEREQDVTETSV